MNSFLLALRTPSNGITYVRGGSTGIRHAITGYVALQISGVRLSSTCLSMFDLVRSYPPAPLCLKLAGIADTPDAYW